MSQAGLKKAAVFCILRCNDKFLLLQRANEPNKGKFVPVGGKIDPFESPYNAVIRETMEETGILLPTAKFCGMLTETSPGSYNWVSFIYVADIAFIPAPSCDEGELFWVNEGDLKDLYTPDTDWFIYQYVRDGKPFAFSANYDAHMNLLAMEDEIEGIKLIG
ncbi:MAG: NUDIX domain-containing protein [Saprospiraceae bacterium]|nr:NUDIX domain-containing protein [Saprospiraceae bacterium]